MSISNQVQLITYPDSLGGNLSSLEFVLDKYFPDLFKGGIHILPPFPSSGDRGFAPLTYLEIEPQFGSWSDIKRIGEKYTVLLDLMINHISAKSVYFRDFVVNGRCSQYADMFITLDKIWPGGEPVQKDLEKIFFRRAVPFSDFRIESTGKTERVWTTFGKTDPSEQIDLDIHSPKTRDLIIRFFKNFHDNGVKIVRLDAVGYVIKKRGSSCFFVEPEIYQFLEWVSEVSKSLEVELLPEIHADYRTQFKLAKKGYWIYDFILPYTILDAFFNQTTERLKDYLRIRPHNQFTMLDCHDGIPVKPDLNGLYKYEDAKNVVDICLQRGGNLSYILSTEHKDPNGFDVHQIRGTIYSLFGENDDIYLAARALQFFTPGIPQVYYVGLLAGINDVASVVETGEGREINRHNYSANEVEEDVKKPVVKKLVKLIRFRNTHPAFGGKFTLNPSSNSEISITWTHQEEYATLLVNAARGDYHITFSDPSTGREVVLD